MKNINDLNEQSKTRQKIITDDESDSICVGIGYIKMFI